jgi:hypothetical protein
MAEKTGPSAPQAAQGGFPEAPPSYEATVGGAGKALSNFFVSVAIVIKISEFFRWICRTARRA